MSSPVYFEVSWSILSTICVGNVFFGCLVCGITSFTGIAAVPILSSVGGAIANGLCYYIYYQPHHPVNRAVASVFGDILWLAQEAGLLFYSYIILQRILHGVRWRIFFSLFWLLMLSTAITRAFIAVFRVRSIIHDDDQLQITINYLHIGYFSSMALLECISAYFLIVLFTSAAQTSLDAALKVGLFRYLTRSTEVRVAVLALQGILRTVTHSLQTPGQRAENLASQLDRLTYTFICLYPVVLYIDLLASKLRFINQSHAPSSNDYPGVTTQRRTMYISERDYYPQVMCKHLAEVQCGKTVPENTSGLSRQMSHTNESRKSIMRV